VLGRCSQQIIKNATTELESLPVLIQQGSVRRAEGSVNTASTPVGV
jgi:hypothetical protein